MMRKFLELWGEWLKPISESSHSQTGYPNPYKSPALEISGKIICGFDFSTSMRKHGKVASWHWCNETLPELQSRWPGLEMHLLGVNAGVFEIEPCLNESFVHLSKIPRFQPEVFVKKRVHPNGMLQSGSAFEDFFVRARNIVKPLLRQRKYPWEPIIVALICDGAPRRSSATIQDAERALKWMRKRGVKVSVSCFVPKTPAVRREMATFRDSLFPKEVVENEFAMIFQTESSNDQSSSVALASLVDSIMATGEQAESESKLASDPNE
ncbi:hypothetical protein BVY02_00360 [bacterium J17]|nr:hypothetical protein BVY02_00360 [bacterium J17]